MGELLLARSAIHQAVYQLESWLNSVQGCLFVSFETAEELSGCLSRLKTLQEELEVLENAINA